MTLLENKMTPEQITEGQKRARDFKPRQARLLTAAGIISA
jgi:hypothetical protein